MLPVHNTPSKALAMEEAIVERFSDPAVMHDIHFWTTDQCLVVPASLKRNPQYTEACALLGASGWPVILRKTGGGITPQGPGVLNVSLAYALDPVEKPTIHGVYHMFCAPLLRLCDQFGCPSRTDFVPGSFCDGEYNIVVEDRKVMGTAQRWTRIRAVVARQIVFAHALILFDADLPASIEAVNHLHRACSIDQPVDLAVHANMKQLAEQAKQEIDQQQVVSMLAQHYHTEMTVLTA